MSIEKLKPTSLWQHFSKICSIPHPSHHEAALVEHILAFADRRGLTAQTDKTGNVIVEKPASSGMENRQGVVLQAHLDMVPQKLNTLNHDFTTDPIKAYVDGEWVTAEGTTLGADNGIGAAAILAILESEDIAHGPLEALFTINEESGMTGAKGLQTELLKGRILINTDAEHEGEIFVGCAGGADINATASYETQTVPASFSFHKISVTGLLGGHSGLNISDYRGNAIRMLARLLKNLPADEFCLASFNGGTLRNAIPRDAYAVIGVPERQAAMLDESIKETTNLLKHELAGVEPSINVTMSTAEQPESVMLAEDSKKWINALHIAPLGVHRMSSHFSGVVETSNNLAVAVIDNGQIKISNMTRSLVNSARDDYASAIAGFYSAMGAIAEVSGEYPGWKPDHKSSLLELVKKTHHELFDYEPAVKVIHAGLECGLLGEKYPHWDMISFGPLITGAHSPDERANIGSVERFWKLLTTVLNVIPHSSSS